MHTSITVPMAATYHKKKKKSFKTSIIEYLSWIRSGLIDHKTSSLGENCLNKLYFGNIYIL